MSAKEETKSEKKANYLFEGFPEDYKNPKGIPRADFVTNVAEYLKKNKIDEKEAKAQQNNMYSKYYIMENNFTYQKREQNLRIIEIDRTIKAIKFLMNKDDEEETDTTYALSDNVYGNAKILKTGKVILYLGAKVYVEQTYEEALKTLTDSKNLAKQKIEDLEEHLAFLNDQLNIVKVNFSRIHNHAVMYLRPKKK